ncbi:MAG: metallophosphoesterase, partial [Maribacter sp.]
MTNPLKFFGQSIKQYCSPTLFVLTAVFINSCATYKENQNISFADKNYIAEPTYSFYIAGGFGNSSDNSNSILLEKFKEELNEASENSTLILTGDNISEEDGSWEKDSLLIDQQLHLVKNYKGKTVFMPGNNEWKSYELNKMERVEDYLKEIDLKDVAVFPENGCPIEYKVINDNLDLIILDSKWFVSNWSRLEGINRKCPNITTRRRFMEELEGYINDAQGKNLVIAMHHPAMDNGVYTGTDTFKGHMTPLPILGTLRNSVMDLGAFNPEHVNSRRYKYLRIAVSALAQASD